MATTQFLSRVQTIVILFNLAIFSGVLFENRPALYFCNYKENEENDTRMLDTLFIDDFVDIMDQYFHY